jgi:hypothetical protein
MSLAKIKWIELPCKMDARGNLTIVEGNAIPFPMARFFYTHGVPPDAERGGHAHRVTEQLVIAVTGSFKLDLTDSRRTQSYLIDSPYKGIYIPPVIWDRLYEFSPGAVCLVVASTHYLESDYIRDWNEFQRLARVQA